MNQQSRNIAEGQAHDHRHERLFVDLTRCSLGSVTRGRKHVIRHTIYLGPSLPCGLLNSFACFVKRLFRLTRRCGGVGVALLTPSRGSTLSSSMFILR